VNVTEHKNFKTKSYLIFRNYVHFKIILSYKINQNNVCYKTHIPTVFFAISQFGLALFQTDLPQYIEAKRNFHFNLYFRFRGKNEGAPYSQGPLTPDHILTPVSKNLNFG
jgi:hypothetical protein